MPETAAVVLVAASTLVVPFDYLVWHTLIFGDNSIGAIIGLTILAIVSIPVTVLAILLWGFVGKALIDG